LAAIQIAGAAIESARLGKKISIEEEHGH